jgi:hypothetical protein
MAATALPPFDLAAIGQFIAEAGGAQNAYISRPVLLPGGAIRQNWGFHARLTGGPFDGEHELVLRTDAPTGIASSLSRVEEFAVLRAARAAGVSVPEPLRAG